MKKKIQLLCCIFLLLFLTGCGIELESSMNLNSHFSGYRVVTCNLTNANIQRYFSGTIEEFDDIIKEACPSSIAYKKESNGDHYTYSFTLGFTSKSDYTKKVSSLLSFKPQITYQHDDSPFVSGLIYKENFTSQDLMTWLYTAFYEKGYITQEDSDDLWTLKSTTFSFNKKEYEVDNQININDMNYVPISSIDMTTTQNTNRTFTRTIAFDLPKESLEKHQNSILDYFSNYKDYISWDSTSSGKQLKITFTESNFSDLAKTTRLILHSNQSYGTSEISLDENHSFTFQESYKEKINFQHFVGEDNQVMVNYIFQSSDHQEQPLLSKKVKTATVSFDTTTTQKIKNYQIVTVFQNSEQMRRYYIFDFQQPYTTAEQNKLKTELKKGSIQKVVFQKNNQLQIEQKGSIEDCNHDFSGIVQNCNLAYKTERSFVRGTTSIIQETYDFDFSDNTIQGDYFFVCLKEDEDTSKVEINDGKYKKINTNRQILDKNISKYIKANESIQSVDHYKINGNSFTATYTGSTTSDHLLNISRILLPLLLIVIIGCILYRKHKMILEFIAKKKWKL